MKIKKDITIHQFKEMTHDCDEFWEVVGKQRLWNVIEFYLVDGFADEDGIIDFSSAQDTIRYEGESILRSIGADLTNTIWND